MFGHRVLECRKRVLGLAVRIALGAFECFDQGLTWHTFAAARRGRALVGDANGGRHGFAGCVAACVEGHGAHREVGRVEYIERRGRETIVGLAQVKDVFRSSKLGDIAGSLVIEGIVKRANPIRVLRDNVVIYEGELESLRRFKDDVSEVQ